MLVCAGVMLLFVSGMLIGGIDVVDRKNDRWWFFLQAGVGPTAFVMNWVNQNTLHAPSPTGANDSHTSLSHVNEVGSLFTSMAGMLNVIAIVDCLWAPVVPVVRRRRTEETA